MAPDVRIGVRPPKTTEEGSGPRGAIFEIQDRSREQLAPLRDNSTQVSRGGGEGKKLAPQYHALSPRTIRPSSLFYILASGPVRRGKLEGIFLNSGDGSSSSYSSLSPSLRGPTFICGGTLVPYIIICHIHHYHCYVTNITVLLHCIIRKFVITMLITLCLCFVTDHHVDHAITSFEQDVGMESPEHLYTKYIIILQRRAPCKHYFFAPQCMCTLVFLPSSCLNHVIVLLISRDICCVYISHYIIIYLNGSRC